MVHLFAHLELRVQILIFMAEGIILKSVGQLLVYKIHLKITMCKLTDTGNFQKHETWRLLSKVTWTWKQGEKPDLMWIT